LVERCGLSSASKLFGSPFFSLPLTGLASCQLSRGKLCTQSMHAGFPPPLSLFVVRPLFLCMTRTGAATVSFSRSFDGSLRMVSPAPGNDLKVSFSRTPVLPCASRPRCFLPFFYVRLTNRVIHDMRLYLRLPRRQYRFL